MLVDSFGRVHDYLRVSLTGLCNMNCIYCDPIGEKSGVEHIKTKFGNLDTEELISILDFFVKDCGIKKLRFTGGEPLLRKDFNEILKVLPEWKNNYSIRAGVTTNGSLLTNKLDDLYVYGIDSINISLDSLNEENFKKITGLPVLPAVLRGIQKAISSRKFQIKINMVVLKGQNDHEILSMIEYFKNENISLRFLEYMPLGQNGWEESKLLENRKIFEQIQNNYSLIPLPLEKGGTAKEFQMLDFPLRIGFISSMSDEFCSSCNRLRLSSDGKIQLCLFSLAGERLSLAEKFRAGMDKNEIFSILSNYIKNKKEKHDSVSDLSQANTYRMVELGG